MQASICTWLKRRLCGAQLSNFAEYSRTAASPRCSISLRIRSTVARIFHLQLRVTDVDAIKKCHDIGGYQQRHDAPADYSIQPALVCGLAEVHACLLMVFVVIDLQACGAGDHLLPHQVLGHLGGHALVVAAHRPDGHGFLLVHHGLPGKTLLIFMKKNSLSLDDLYSVIDPL